MKIINSTRSDIGIQPGIIVPAMGVLEVTEAMAETFSKMENVPSVAAHFETGRLKVEGDAPKAAARDMDDEREAEIIAALNKLGDDDYTKTGLPKLNAVNAAMAEGTEPVTDAERDAVWAKVSA